MSDWSNYIDEYCESVDEAYASMTEPLQEPDNETTKLIQRLKNNRHQLVPQKDDNNDDSSFRKSLIEDE